MIVFSEKAANEDEGIWGPRQSETIYLVGDCKQNSCDLEVESRRKSPTVLFKREQHLKEKQKEVDSPISVEL